jgi:molybdenum cofactor cytidylyltransferase
MERHSSKSVISACVLAAGSSSRFGATKLVRHFSGKPLVQHARLAAQGACEGMVTLVVGHDWEAVTNASAGLSDSVTLNPDHKLGMGTSIAAGVRTCRKDADAIMIVLADQPLITATHLNDIISTWSGAETEIIASSSDGIVGPPVLFPRAAFGRLCDLRGDAGAKKMLADGAFHVRSVEFPAALLDIDTPEDLQVLDQD